jgi:hypothetical protein
MQRRRLDALEVSAVGLGCATMTPFYDEPDRDAAIDTLRRAREIGVDFLDSSDAYGQGRNEELIADRCTNTNGSGPKAGPRLLISLVETAAVSALGDRRCVRPGSISASACRGIGSPFDSLLEEVGFEPRVAPRSYQCSNSEWF